MNLWRSLAGDLEIRITSADIPGILEKLSRCNIALTGIRYRDELTAAVRISRREYADTVEILEKSGADHEILRRRGLFFLGKAALKRPVLLTGLVFFFFMAMFLPTRVLFIQVEGNASVPTKRILEAAAESGICFGASRREVRSEKTKNALLGAVPQLSWAGVNTSGCVATISVRERQEQPEETKSADVSSLVAVRDGIIVSCTVTKGNPLCAVGQAVRAGQTLISGYTDCGLLVQATRAEGEVMAMTRHFVTAITLPEGRFRLYQQRVTRKYSLLLGKKRINFANSSGICDSTCGRMYEEYYITLPGGFQLPVALAVEEHICWETERYEKAPEDAFEALTGFCDAYVKSQMVSGSILDAQQISGTAADAYRLEAQYGCLEMIGRCRQERKVETNGESG